MTRRVLNVAELDQRSKRPDYSKRATRAHRGIRQKVSRTHKHIREPHVVPTERDHKEFDMLRPEEVEQGYQVRWSEGPPKFEGFRLRST